MRDRLRGPRESRRVFLVDPALCSNRGHYFHFAHCLVTPLEQRGHRVCVLTNRFIEPDLRKALPAYPAFRVGHSHQFWEHYQHVYNTRFARKSRSALLRLLRFAPAHMRPFLHYRIEQLYQRPRTVEDLQRADAEFSFRTEDVLIINSLEQTHLPAFFNFLGSLPKARRPTAVFILHFCILPRPGDESDREAPLRHSFDALRRAGIDNSCFFVADSDYLAREYSQFGKISVGVVPIPHGRALAAHVQRKRSGSPVHFAYVGIGAVNKGFHLLPPLVRSLSREIASGDVSFEIQAQFLSEDPVLKDALQQLRRYPVILHEGAMDSAKYYDILGRADVVLQPYDWPGYHAQTSGIFAESRSFGAISIVSKGTWAARNVTQQGGGVICLPDDSQSLIEAALETLANFERLREEAERQAEHWNQLNSPDGFIAAVNAALGHPAI